MGSRFAGLSSFFLVPMTIVLRGVVSARAHAGADGRFSPSDRYAADCRTLDIGARSLETIAATIPVCGVGLGLQRARVDDPLRFTCRATDPAPGQGGASDSAHPQVRAA